MSHGRVSISAEELRAVHQVAERNLPTDLEIAFAKAALTGVIPFCDRSGPFAQRARGLLARISYRDWEFEEVAASIGDRDYVFRLRFVAIDAETGKPSTQRGRHWHVVPEMTDAEIIRTVLLAILTAEEHEARESFLFDGRPLFGPHFDLPS